MVSSATARVAAHDPRPSVSEPGVRPVELLWDLVFVFAITQVTTLLWRDLNSVWSPNRLALPGALERLMDRAARWHGACC